MIPSKLFGPRISRLASATVQFLVGPRTEKCGTCAKSAQIGTGFASTVAQGKALDSTEIAYMSRGLAFRRVLVSLNMTKVVVA
jgi:hypothetical protein